MSQVSVISTNPSSVLEDYSRSMHMIDYQSAFDKDTPVIIKLNLSWSLYYPACSTEPWQLEGIIKTLRNDGYESITAMENKTVVTNVMKGVKNNLWSKILKKYNVDFVPLTDVEWVEYSEYVTDLPAIDEIFGSTHKIPKPLIGANIIHPPTMKTHGHTTITGSMKNAFGGLITERRHHCHKRIHEILVDLLKIQKAIHPSVLTVMDGTVCGNGKGPRTMEPVIKNYLLASTDSVAIDAVAARMMGFNPEDIKFIKGANEQGLGNIDDIKILGEDISDINFGFKTGESLVVWGDKLFRKGPLSFLEPLIFHTPFFKLPILASAVYHDFFWYPIVGKLKIAEFMKTEWGKLLETYKK
jgi:uncharacterized protein (DUF362 family)